MDHDGNGLGPFYDPTASLSFTEDCSQKNVLSVLMHCFAMACILSVVWLVAGYSLALEGTGQWIGDLSALFGKGLDGSDSGGSDIPGILGFAFQMTFFIITPALVVGTFVERVKFSAVMLFADFGGFFAMLLFATWSGTLMVGCSKKVSLI